MLDFHTTYHIFGHFEHFPAARVRELLINVQNLTWVVLETINVKLYKPPFLPVIASRDTKTCHFTFLKTTAQSL